MPYSYSFDPIPVHLVFLGDHALVRKAIDLLRAEISSCNEKALDEGLSVPFAKEVRDLDFIIKQFAGAEAAGSPTIPGLAVGSLRYLKAGLVLLAAHKEREISEKVAGGWPEKIIESMRGVHEDIVSFSRTFEVPPADILNEIVIGPESRRNAGSLAWDVFISHASEDKDALARPLYDALAKRGVRVWFDEAMLELGDSLRRKIDEGLNRCRFGIVILSPRFLEKEWPQRELDGLVARETASGEKAILPIWHDLDRDTLMRYSPPLADRLAARSAEGIPTLVDRIIRVLER